MGKKSKRNPKVLKASTDVKPTESPNYNFAELSLEQFEKSLAAMLETLNNKKLEFLKATQLTTPEPYANELQKTPTKVAEKSDYINYPIDNGQEVQWNIPDRPLQHDQSTASGGSIDSSYAFMFPKSSQRMKEMMFKRSSNCASLGLNRTPLAQVRKDYTNDYKLSDSTTGKDLHSFQTKDSLSNIKTPCKEECDYMWSNGASDLLSQSLMQEWSSGGATENRYHSSRVNNFFDLIEKKPDMYIRGNKYYLLEELSLETLFYRIYFEKYTYQDLKEYIPFTLKKVSDLEYFLDTLYSSIRDFSIMAREYILEQLMDVVIKVKRVLKGRNGELQLVQEFGGYKRFGKHATTYTSLITKICEACKSLEAVAAEVERVCSVYLRTFLKEKRKFCCKEFHKQVFVKYFYNEPLIKDFLLSITRYFEERYFYASKYPTTIKELKELNEFFYKTQPDCSKKVNRGAEIQTLSADYSTEVEEKIVKAHDLNARSIEEYNYAVKDLQKVYQSMESPYYEKGIMENNEDMLLQEEENNFTVKPKNKKNKKKKKNNKKGKVEEKENNIPEPEEVLSTMEGSTKGNENILIKEEVLEDDWNGWPHCNDEVEEFARRLDQNKGPKDVSERIKPNINKDWIEGLKKKLKKKLISQA